MKVVLTQRFLESLKKAPAERTSINDIGCHNLALYHYPSGKKVWVWRGRENGKPKQVRGGEFPHVGLADARTWAASITEQTSVTGKNAKHGGENCDWLFDLYMKHEGSSRRSAGEKRRSYDHDIKPVIGSRSYASIEYEDLAAIIAAKAEHAPTMSNNLQALISRWFRWATTKGRPLSGLRTNPAADLVKMSSPRKRKRALSEDEIRWFLTACDQIENRHAETLMYILYTAARKTEAFEMPWAELNFLTGVWWLQEHRSKNGQELLLVLPPVIMEMLQRRHKATGNSVYVWPSRIKEVPFAGHYKLVAMLHKKMEEIAGRERGEAVSIPRWTIHDLRRTAATGMHSIVDEDGMPRIPPHVIERVQNHKIGGVAGIYNRHDYFVEKKQALLLWAAHIERIRTGASASIAGIQSEGTEPVALRA